MRRFHINKKIKVTNILQQGFNLKILTLKYKLTFTKDIAVWEKVIIHVDNLPLSNHNSELMLWILSVPITVHQVCLEIDFLSPFHDFVGWMPNTD